MWKSLVILLGTFFVSQALGLPDKNNQLTSHKVCGRVFTDDVDLETQPEGPLPGAYDHPDTQQRFSITSRQRPRLVRNYSWSNQSVSEPAPVEIPNGGPPVKAAPPPPSPQAAEVPAPPEVLPQNKTFRVSGKQAAEIEGQASFLRSLTAEQSLAFALVKILRPEFFEPQVFPEKLGIITDAVFDVQKPLRNAKRRKSSILWESFFKVSEGAKGEREQKKRLADFWRKLGLYNMFMALYTDNPELHVNSEMSLIEIYRSMRTCCYDVEPFEHFYGLSQGVRPARFQDPKSRGPLMLLTLGKAKKLPDGTVLWNLQGEFQIVGAQKLHLGDEDYVWGVRPLKHEFDTRPGL